MKHIVVVLVWLMLCSGVSGAFAADIEITTPGKVAIPTGQPQFLPLGPSDPEVERTIATVLANDLDLSGMFEIIPREAYLDDAARLTLSGAEVNFSQWKLLGAQLLIKGAYQLKGEQLELKVRLFDVDGRRLLTGHNYRGGKMILDACSIALWMRYSKP